MPTSATTIEAKQILTDFLDQAGRFYLTDLTHIPDDKIDVQPMGAARTVRDFTAECINFNLMAGAALRGDDNSMPSEEERASLAGLLDSKDKLKAAIEGSLQNITDALQTISEEGLARIVTAPWGEPLSAFRLAHVAATHMMYHDGQLNYIQALYGDSEVHWMS